jgi:hypothetical protein
MRKVLISVTKIIGRFSLIILGVLSLVVLFFFVDARLHPGEKGISNTDLQDYVKISFMLLILFGMCKVLHHIFNKPTNGNYKNSN